MKLTWHIVKKDFRRFWIGALLLVGLTGMKLLLLNSVFSHAISPEWNTRMFRYQSLLLAAEVLFSFFLAVAAVHEDPVTESGAFWQTLPINRRQLLGAKLLSVILICVLPPMLTLAAGWCMFGLPPGLLGWPLAVVAQVQLGLSLLALAFGSLTRNVAQVLFWIVGGLLAFVISVVLADPFVDRLPLTTPGVRFTHIFITILIGSMAGLAITLNQYLSRSRHRSIVFFAVGFLLCFYVSETARTRHSFDFTPMILRAQHELDNNIARLRVNISQAEIAEAKPDSDATVMLHFSVDDPDPWQVVLPVGWVNGQWGPFKANRRFPFPDFAKPYLAREDRIKQALERAFEFSPAPAVNRLSFGAESTLSAFEAGLLKNQSTPYQGRIDLSVREGRIDGQTELAVGSTIRSDYGTARILGADSDGNVIRVEMEGKVSALNPDPGWFVGANALVVPVCTINYALVNKKTRTILTLSRNSIGMGGYAYGIAVGHSRLQFVLPLSEKGTANLADWALVEVRGGIVHRAIKSFNEDVFLKEVPVIAHDPSWVE